MKKPASKVRAANIRSFVAEVWKYYRAHGRTMPWRTKPTPYNVIVSEIMLQQTQVSRVITKFVSFIARFPDWRSLAKASTREVLQEWSGLGYNRRALYLKRIAEIITDNGRTKGAVPNTFDALRELPGIGSNTAGSILAFAFNIPHPFIETNIRSAYIHYFFPEIERSAGKRACKKIDDDEIMPFIEAALAAPKNRSNPREWHYALMDYGADLKKRLPNPSRRSAHHIKQSRFEGSNRQLRAKILRLMLSKRLSLADLSRRLPNHSPKAIATNVALMKKEGFFE